MEKLTRSWKINLLDVADVVAGVERVTIGTSTLAKVTVWSCDRSMVTFSGILICCQHGALPIATYFRCFRLARLRRSLSNKKLDYFVEYFLPC